MTSDPEGVQRNRGFSYKNSHPIPADGVVEIRGSAWTPPRQAPGGAEEDRRKQTLTK